MLSQPLQEQVGQRLRSPPPPCRHNPRGTHLDFFLLISAPAQFRRRLSFWCHAARMNHRSRAADRPCRHLPRRPKG